MEDSIKKKIDVCIEEFFLMERGEKIWNAKGEMLLAKYVCVRRMGLKHIIESRKEDGCSVEEIKDMVERAVETMLYPELDIGNTNGKYPNSRIVGRAYPHERRALLVVYQLNNEIKIVYNLFYRELGRFEKMK
ncbi:MAG TPA: hypothetical protein VMA75_00830 [Candidatus Paceibacterota bacterium]|nr:hypothetical protein [Candidatus Paceibacterota bacterium]